MVVCNKEAEASLIVLWFYDNTEKIKMVVDS